MARGTRSRRGQTWQSQEWRRFLNATIDLGERAQAAFSRLRSGSAGAPAPSADEHSCARMTAPYTGDGALAAGPFAVRPEYRGFA